MPSSLPEGIVLQRLKLVVTPCAWAKRTDLKITKNVM